MCFVIYLFVHQNEKYYQSNVLYHKILSKNFVPFEFPSTITNGTYLNFLIGNFVAY